MVRAPSTTMAGCYPVCAGAATLLSVGGCYLVPPRRALKVGGLVGGPSSWGSEAAGWSRRQWQRRVFGPLGRSSEAPWACGRVGVWEGGGSESLKRTVARSLDGATVLLAASPRQEACSFPWCARSLVGDSVS